MLYHKRSTAEGHPPADRSHTSHQHETSVESPGLEIYWEMGIEGFQITFVQLCGTGKWEWEGIILRFEHTSVSEAASLISLSVLLGREGCSELSLSLSDWERLVWPEPFFPEEEKSLQTTFRHSKYSYSVLNTFRDQWSHLNTGYKVLTKLSEWGCQWKWAAGMISRILSWGSEARCVRFKSLVWKLKLANMKNKAQNGDCLERRYNTEWETLSTIVTFVTFEANLDSNRGRWGGVALADLYFGNWVIFNT